MGRGTDWDPDGTVGGYVGIKNPLAKRRVIFSFCDSEENPTSASAGYAWPRTLVVLGNARDRNGRFVDRELHCPNAPRQPSRRNHYSAASYRRRAEWCMSGNSFGSPMDSNGDWDRWAFSAEAWGSRTAGSNECGHLCRLDIAEPSCHPEWYFRKPSLRHPSRRNQCRNSLFRNLPLRFLLKSSKG